MANKMLKTFNTVDKKFDPEQLMDKSTDNLLFNAQQVESAYGRALMKAKTFISRVNMLGTQVSKISLAGLKGSNITNSIQNYRDKVAKVTNSLESAKENFTKAVQSRLDRVSTGEKDAARLSGLVDSIGMKAEGVVDQAMDTANDIISWASSIDPFSNDSKPSSKFGNDKQGLSPSFGNEKDYQLIGPEGGLPTPPKSNSEKSDWTELIDFTKNTGGNVELQKSELKHYEVEDLPPIYQDEVRRMENQIIGPQWANEVDRYKNSIMEKVENTTDSLSSWIEEGKNNVSSAFNIIKDPINNMPMPGDFDNRGLYL